MTHLFDIIGLRGGGIMSIYLESFTFPSSEAEFHLYYRQPSIFNNLYPAAVLTNKLRRVEFDPVTILYGGNGSGKSTALNLIAQKLGIVRATPYNKSTFFEKYASSLCRAEMRNFTLTKKIITSDDVFRNIFDTRERNEQIDEKREEVYDKYYSLANIKFKDYAQGKELVDKYAEMREMNEAKRRTANSFAKMRTERNIIGKSNGESALDYFTEELKDGGLYLLDEPENSLSAPFQVKLSKFLGESARYFNCQLIIATHSPFMLSIEGAKIYNLDTEPADIVYDWTELENMRVYYEFFKEYKNKFE